MRSFTQCLQKNNTAIVFRVAFGTQLVNLVFVSDLKQLHLLYSHTVFQICSQLPDIGTRDRGFAPIQQQKYASIIQYYLSKMFYSFFIYQTNDLFFLRDVSCLLHWVKIQQPLTSPC